MRTAKIEIRKDTTAALEELGAGFVRAWRSGKSDGDIFQFESPKSLFRMLTPKRWELVEKLQAIGPSSLRGLARALGRDVKRVHDDVSALLDYGLVERQEDGKLWVPYGVIHIDFDLRAAA
jgi:predicted transcriptional regulator